MATGPAESWNSSAGALLPPETKTKAAGDESPLLSSKWSFGTGKAKPQLSALTTLGPCLPSSSFPETGMLQQGKGVKTGEKCLSHNEKYQTRYLQPPKSLLARLMSVLKWQF